jgi:hypothetical protein
MTAPNSLDRGRFVKPTTTVVRPSTSKIRKLFLATVATMLPAVLFARPWSIRSDGYAVRLGVLALGVVLYSFLGWHLWRQRRNERLVADGRSVSYTDWRGRVTRIGRDDVRQASLVTVRPARSSSPVDERLVVERSSPVPPLWIKTGMWNRDDVQGLFDRIGVRFQTVDGVHPARELPTMFPRLRLPLGERRPVVTAAAFLIGLGLVFCLFCLVAVVLF